MQLFAQAVNSEKHSYFKICVIMQHGAFQMIKLQRSHLVFKKGFAFCTGQYHFLHAHQDIIHKKGVLY